MRRHGCVTQQELKRKLGTKRYRQELFQKNVERAAAFARELRHRKDSYRPVVTPGPLVAPDWDQAQYHKLWEELIATRISVVFFNDGWAFSNGCTREFAAALESGVSTVDARGQKLSHRRGVKLVNQALQEILNHNMKPVSLKENLARLQKLGPDERAKASRQTGVSSD